MLIYSAGHPLSEWTVREYKRSLNMSAFPERQECTPQEANLPFYFPNSACPKLPYNKETSPSFYFASELGFLY